MGLIYEQESAERLRKQKVHAWSLVRQRWLRGFCEEVSYAIIMHAFALT